jgi:RHS repeat-associated protein
MWKLAADTLPAVQIEGQGLVRPVVRYTSVETASNPYNTPSGNFQPRFLPDLLLASVTNPRGHATRFRLGPFWSWTRIEEPLGRTTRVTRDAHGRITTLLTPSGHWIDYTFTGVDLTKIADSTTGEVVTMTYEPVYHQLTSSTNGTSRAWYYWSAGKLDSTDVGAQDGSQRTHFSYEVINGRFSGRVLLATDPAGHGTGYAYHASGTRNLRQASVAGRTTKYGYDAYGRLAADTAPDNSVTRWQYDILNRDTLTIGPISDTTITRYNSLFVTAVRDAKGQLYQFTPNALGWVERRIDPAGLSETFGYDVNGNALRHTNRRGQTVTMGYDAFDAVSSRTADGLTATYVTDALDRFTTASNAESIDTLRLDVAGRQVAEISVRGGRRYERTSAYNAQGLRTQLQIISPWTASVGYRYDAKMRLDTLIAFGGGRTVIGYNRDGQPTGITLPTTPATTIARDYPGTHTPSKVLYTAANAQQFGAHYAYDTAALVGRRIDRLGPPEEQGRHYSYDRLRRLTGYADYVANTGGSSCSNPTWFVDPQTGESCWPQLSGRTVSDTSVFAYDSVGNRKDRGGVTAVGNRLVKFDGDSLVYDEDGNLRKRIRAGAEVQRLHWNSLGELVAVWTSGADSVSFGYDGWGRRVRKSWASSGAFLRYIHDGDDLLAEEDQLWNVTEYAHYPGVDQPHSFRRNLAATYYYLTDHPGSVVAVVDGAGAVVGQYKYAPFGTRQSYAGSVASAFQFGARELDEETGLYYNRARYYDPRLGRFVSEDPIGLAGGINLYAYAGNDPVNNTDPFGLDPCTQLQKDHGWTDVVGADGEAECKSGGGLPPVQITATQVGFFDAFIYRLWNRESLWRGVPEMRNLVLVGVPSLMVGPAVAPAVTNVKLAHIVRDLYKGARARSPIGTGSTADAIRYEQLTGKPVGGIFHTRKGEQYLRALDKWLARNLNASDYDRLVARSIRDDLVNALRGW